MNSFIKFFAAMCCVVSIAQSGFAQFSKGSVLLGGGIGFYSDSYNNTNSYNSSQSISNGSSIGIYPNVGYTFKDNWVAFFETGYRNSSETRDDHQVSTPDIKNIIKTEGYVVPINVGVQRFWALGNKFSFGLKGAAGLSLGKEIGTNERIPAFPNSKTTSTSNNFEWRVGVSPSINYILGEKVNLSLSIGSLGYYRYNNKQLSEREGYSETQSNEYIRSSFYSSISLNNIQIGAYYILQPKTQKAE